MNLHDIHRPYYTTFFLGGGGLFVAFLLCILSLTACFDLFTFLYLKILSIVLLGLNLQSCILDL